MEGFLWFISIVLFLMLWSTNRDYTSLKKEVGKVDDYLDRRTKSLDQIYAYRKRTLDEREARIDEQESKSKKAIDAYITHVAEEKKAEVQKEIDKLNETRKAFHEKKEFLYQFLSSKISDFPIVASVIADYEEARDHCIAESLERKKRPAKSAAEERRSFRAEKRALIQENKAYKWELEYIRNLLPWLADLEDEPIEPTTSYENPYYKDSDAAGYWLTPEEYQKLPDTEKYQRALDRYKKRKKTNAEIGRDYERYIGYLYEKDGYTVTYYGIERGLDDLGRDLICIKGDKVHIVQCKCWSNKKKKVIREKHLNQLYGTVVAYKVARSMGITIDDLAKITSDELQIMGQGNLDLYSITPVFCSTVPFSPTALAFAKILDIRCRVKPLDDYPMIKCNISRTGERIYHLPFDQQYDKTIITPVDGECYAWTVEEAEKKKFRRAKRWKGNAPTQQSSPAKLQP